MIESHITYLLDCLRTMKRRGLQTVEVQPQVQQTYNEEIRTGWDMFLLWLDNQGRFYNTGGQYATGTHLAEW